MKGGGDSLIFKRGIKKVVVKQTPSDDLEFMDYLTTQADAREKFSGSDIEESGVSISGFESKEIFIWKDVCYSIPYGSRERVLWIM